MRPHWPVGPSSSLRATVQADIAEGARYSVAAANDDDALADELERVEIAGLRNVVQMADHLPGRGEDAFPLGGKKAGVGIDPSWQAEIIIRIGEGDVGHRRLQVNGPAGPGQPQREDCGRAGPAHGVAPRTAGDAAAAVPRSDAWEIWGRIGQ